MYDYKIDKYFWLSAYKSGLKEIYIKGFRVGPTNLVCPTKIVCNKRG